MTAADRTFVRGRSLYAREDSPPPCNAPSPEDISAEAHSVSGTDLVSHGYPEMRATPVKGCNTCANLAANFVITGWRDLLLEVRNHPHETPKLQCVRDWQRQGVTA